MESCLIRRSPLVGWLYSFPRNTPSHFMIVKTSLGIVSGLIMMGHLDDLHT